MQVLSPWSFVERGCGNVRSACRWFVEGVPGTPRWMDPFGLRARARGSPSWPRVGVARARGAPGWVHTERDGPEEPMTEKETAREGQGTAVAPHTGGVPLLALVMTGALRLREHRAEK